MTWSENANGNFVLVEDDELVATVYRKPDGWRAIWNGAPDGRRRNLRATLDTSDEARAALALAIKEGPNSTRWWPPDGIWRRAVKGNLYIKFDGRTVSVKQAKSGSFFAASSNGDMLGQGDRNSWFSTEEEAVAAVDDCRRTRGAWVWI